MGKTRILGALLATLAIAYGCGGSGGSGGTTAASLADFQFPLTSTDVATGEAVYAEYCEGCHPGGQKGDGPKIADHQFQPAKVRWIVRGGLDDMPAFGPKKISDENLEALLAYTETFGVVVR